MADDDDAAATAKTAEVRRLAQEAEARRLATEEAARAEEARRTEEARLRAVALGKYEAAHEAIWAQATAVVNVKALIPIVLDHATNTYTKMRAACSPPSSANMP